MAMIGWVSLFRLSSQSRRIKIKNVPKTRSGTISCLPFVLDRGTLVARFILLESYYLFYFEQLQVCRNSQRKIPLKNSTVSCRDFQQDSRLQGVAETLYFATALLDFSAKPGR